METVSVIMPCFNDGKYIKDSIDCVLSQTYKNIELIIIDDGSTDQTTIKVLNNINNPKIKILKLNKVGVACARNKGIELASGKYILPLDSDDLIDKTYVEKAVNILQGNSDIGIVYCEAEFFGQQTGKWNLPEYSIGSMLVDNIIFVTAMFKKSDWQLCNGFDETFIHGLEDYDFWLSILELDRTVVKIPEILFKYRIKPMSRNRYFSNNKNNIKKTYEKIYIKHKNLYSKYDEEYKLHLRNRFIDNKCNELNKSNKINQIKQLPLLKYIINNAFIKNKIKKILTS